VTARVIVDNSVVTRQMDPKSLDRKLGRLEMRTIIVTDWEFSVRS